MLGINIANQNEQTLYLNYHMYIDKTRCILSTWKKCNLSLIARVNVVNTLIASIVVYKMLVLPKIPDDIVKQIRKIVMDFIWSGKKSKIGLEILQLSKDSGGLGLVNLKHKDTALKTTWIPILANDTKYAALVYKLIAPELQDYFWRCNLAEWDAHLLTDSPFWRDVFKAWLSINYDKASGVTYQIIWWNSRIRIQGSPIFWKEVFNSGLVYVSQLCVNNKFLKSDDARDKFQIPYLKYRGLLSALPKEWVSELKCSVITNTNITSYDLLKDNANLSTRVYQQLINPQVLSRKRTAWEKELYMSIDEDQFLTCVKDSYKFPNVNKYQSFQYRVISRALGISH